MRLPRTLFARAAAGVLLAVLVTAALAACSTGGGPAVTALSPSGAPLAPSGQAPSFIPQFVSSEVVVGQNRILFGILDASGKTTIGKPEIKLEVGFESAAGATIASAPATFVWAIQGERGIYVLNAAFPAAGEWTANITASGGGLPGQTMAFRFQVLDHGSAVRVGAAAPTVRTPTLADVGGDVKKLATDPSPDPAFYTTSADQAIAQHRPFVLVFATPAFCTSGQCGPTLDGVKAVAKDEPGVTFINVEPYKLEFVDGRLQPVVSADRQLQPTDVTNAWGILSEPWVFVVDRNGIVRGSFEAIIAPDELRAAIAAVK